MASTGPLDSFVFPGVITQTRVQAPTAAGGGALRYAALIGVGEEVEQVTNSQMVRGSSSTSANVIVGENLADNGQSSNVLDGVNVEFFTRFKPIVLNDGPGTYATQPTDVIVTVDSVRVPVASVNGKLGKIVLVDAPNAGQLVEVAYYYKRKDARVEGENLSIQASGTTATFMVRSKNIVDGTNGGRYLTGTGSGTVEVVDENGTRRAVPVFTVLVNGSVAEVLDIVGSTRTFTLASTPAAGASILVTYFTNDWKDTFDVLPAAEVSSISYVGRGSSPTPDWRAGKDYVLLNGNELHWGNSVSVFAGDNSGDTVFGSNQTHARLIDNRVHKQRILTAAAAGTKSIILPAQPVTGSGTGEVMTDPLDGTVVSYDDLKVFAGVPGVTGIAGSFMGTFGATGVAEIPVVSVDGATVTLGSAVPAGNTVWATYYVNKLFDGKWNVQNTTAGAVGTGKYTVSSIDNEKGSTATAYQVKHSGGLVPGTDVTFLDQAEVTWDGLANGSTNVFVPPTYNGIVRVDETVTIEIDAAIAAGQTFTVTSTNAKGTGSGSVKTGAIGATYVDPVTGFTIALASAPALGGDISFTVSKSFTVGSTPELGIPGILLEVDTTAGVAVNDTAVVQGMALNGAGGTEPEVGDGYTVKFERVKTDYSVKYVTSMEEASAYYGRLYTGNPIMIAASLAFQNGAPALAIKQIKKNSGGVDANVSDYIAGIDVFDDPIPNGTRPALIQPITANPAVVAYLKASNSKQSSPKYRNERTSYMGFRVGTTMDTVINTCRALSTEFVTMLYPDSVKITIPNASGTDTQVTLGGEYVAVAMAGADLNPGRDVATPLTNNTLAGFDSLGRKVKTSDAQLIASAGCTMLEQKGPGVLKVLMALTTDMSGPLTKDPRIIEIKHEIQKGSRIVTDPFIGVKGLPTVPGQVGRVLTKFLQGKKSAQIIYDFKGVSAVYSEDDPTLIEVSAYYKPIFGVNWIYITFNIATSLG
jgi:hypothetical protein